MNLYEKIKRKEEKISVIGLGYVGMPLAISFAKQVDVIGYDINTEKINLYKSGVDPTNEVGNDVIKNTHVEFTNDEGKIKEAKFHIVSVPTPINLDKTPNLNPVESASATVGRNLTKGSYVIFESTVYPGVTEDVCIPILEQESGLVCGKDFKVGYSPERINPGDKVNTLENIIKIVSGSDSDSLDQIAKVYELIINAGVYKANSIRVAEAAKVVENSQRDINIAFMNELAMVFNRMEIDTSEVIEAMSTKWNSLDFKPGLVGGHCIGVDPYYFLYEADKLGYHSQIIQSDRKINDGMGSYIADNIIKKLITSNKVVSKSKVVILGITFKENTPDTRNSKVLDIINRLREYAIEPIIVDPEADGDEVRRQYDIELTDINEVEEADCLVFAVAHDYFKSLDWNTIDKMFASIENHEKVFIDVKSKFSKNELDKYNYNYWRL